MYLRSDDKVKIIIVFLIVLLPIFLAVFFERINIAWSLISIPICAIVLLFFQLEIYRRIKHLQQQEEARLGRLGEIVMNDYRQLESLLNLHSLLKLNMPLPHFKGWVIAPDFAELLVKLVRSRYPKQIVELGSGASTIVLGYAAKSIGNCKIFSFENDAEQFQKIIEEISYHGIEDVITVLYAPLTKQMFDGYEYEWYKIDNKKLPKQVDMLVVDGPMGTLQKNSRYPALPALKSCLTSEAIIILDDANRDDENEIAELWIKSLPKAQLKILPDMEKGAAIIEL